MNKLLLPNNQYIEVILTSDNDVCINFEDRITNRGSTIGYWLKKEKIWMKNWDHNEMFKWCKKYPQLGRLILKAQNHKEVIPVILQWKCFKRKFKLTIHNLIK